MFLFLYQQYVSEILRVLDESDRGLSVPEMQRVLNLRKNQIDLSKNTPFGRPTQNKPKNVEIIAFPRLGGLHHRYDNNILNDKLNLRIFLSV
jgi:hypothetical protein